MSAVCQQSAINPGEGIVAALHAVDCLSSQLSAEAFGRLFAPGGSLADVLTILLTLYVAFFAIGLLLGRSSLGVRTLVPRMISLGLVLTFATSWLAYQSVVWNLFVAAPDQLAGIIAGGQQSASLGFARKLDIVFQAVQQASAGQSEFEAFSPPGMMWMGAIMLLLGTVGVLVTARIALALLVAIGPLFVVLALFSGTRGLFVGWLKGLVMMASIPLLAVLGGSIMLEMAVPVLGSLSPNPGEIDPQAAMAFFLIGAVHAALMAMMIKLASTLVAGWRVFGLATSDERSGAGQNGKSPAASPIPLAAGGLASVGASTAPERLRAISPAGIAAQPAGNGDTGHARTRLAREAAGTMTQASEAVGGAPQRTRGIGNRFAPAAPRALPRKMENRR